MGIKRFLCLGIAAAVVCTSVPAIVPAQEVQAETERVVDNEAFSISNGVLMAYRGKGGDVIIPEGVTSIGDGFWSVFDNCIGLTSVTIPESVTSIESNAFKGCSRLTSITIPSSVKSIKYDAFIGCSGLTNIIVEKGNSRYDSRNDSNAIIETESNRLCLGCKKTVIPDSVTEIGRDAFRGCSGLTNVVIPDSVTEIGRSAFNGCSGLTSVTIPDSVTSIGEWAFSGCSGLTSVTIPDSVTNIKMFAFSNCGGLTSVTIPDSVTAIEESPFSGCGGLTSIKVEKGNPQYDSRDDCNAIISKWDNRLVQGCEKTVIPSSVTDIGYGAFDGCSGLTNVSIPDGVTSIGENAFSGCSGLESVTIPDSVTNIKMFAFSGCSGLMGAIIPEGVTSIGENAFSGCSGLESVTIPSSVTTIEGTPFFECSGLTSIKVEKGNSRYDSRDDCNAIIETESNTLVQGCNKTIIPSSVTSIGYGAFNGCSGLTSVTIPEGMTSIETDTFSDCSGLTSIKVEKGNPQYDSRDNCNAIIETESNTLVQGCNKTVIPDSVTSIGMNAFYGCSGLTDITIPDSVMSIGESAFDGCSGLTDITIPESVTSIWTAAFDGCSGLTSIKVEKGNPEYDSRDDCNAIIETESNTLVQGCNKTVIPDSVTSIGINAFYGCSGLTSVSIPESVTDIGGSAFNGCSGLTSVVIPSSVTDIGRSAFNGCSGLTSVVIPSSVTSIGEWAFRDCSGLTSVTIPDSVTDIRNGAFGYFIDMDGSCMPIPDFIIYGTSGSEAERYAKDNGFMFQLSSGGNTSQGNQNKTDISKASVTLSANSYTYDGTAKTPSVTVTLAGKTLVLNTDYTVSYRNNTNIGTATVTVTGTGSYTGSKKATFTIVQAEVPKPDSEIICGKTVYEVTYGQKPFKVDAASKSKMTFTSSQPKVAAVDANTGMVTIKNTGAAVITIKAGNTVKEVTVKVSPKKPSVKSAKAEKGRKLAVKWNKDKMASGYQVQISTDRKFKKGVKSAKLSKTSYTFKKLKAGKKYYVRMRSYKKNGKEMLYSAWSKAKTSGKVKK